VAACGSVGSSGAGGRRQCACTGVPHTARGADGARGGPTKQKCTCGRRAAHRHNGGQQSSAAKLPHVKGSGAPRPGRAKDTDGDVKKGAVSGGGKSPTGSRKSSTSAVHSAAPGNADR
jgi:hypothetical protein